MKNNKFISLLLIRASDILLSISLIVLSLPMFVIITLIILFSTGAPVFFAQSRVGKDKKEFTIRKFRSMYNSPSSYIGGRESMTGGNSKAFDDYKRTEKNDSRITKEGKWLRMLHLDELPQLWNVLVGEMSLVGPRPDAPVQELATDEFKWNKRHEVRPGITGLAQISPDAYISNDKRISHDLIWVEKISLGIYLLILIRTFKAVALKKLLNY